MKSRSLQNIVHITTVHPVKDVRIFHKQCQSLAKSGYKVYLLAPCEEDILTDGIQIIALGKPSNRLQRMLILPWKAFKIARKIDAKLYHFHDPELLLIGLLLRMRGKQVIYDVHEDVPRDILLKPWLPKIIRHLTGYLFESFEHFSAKCFRAIITVTPHLANRFSKKNKNTYEIRNYPLSREFSSIEKAKKSPRVCYTGLISRERGIFEMLKIANQGIDLVLAGHFNNKKLQTAVTQLPEWKKINYLGYINRDQIAELYQDSQIGLALLQSGPTFNHSLPNKLFEYMAAGLPVIASDFPLWREIIEKYQCGICVNPVNIDEICAAIQKLLSDPIAATKMGNRGQEAVRNEYNWQTQEEKLLQIYDVIISGKSNLKDGQQ